MFHGDAMAIQKTVSVKKNNKASSSKAINLVPAREKNSSAASSNKTGRAEERPWQGFPIVGIGASAGGLAAFEAFFSALQTVTEPGMAFVLVQHLAPDHKSILTDLIQRHTRMHVAEVEDGMEVQPNCAYIIPPGRDMAFQNGVLRLLEPSAPRGQRLPIDFFFRSLAQDQHERAICIVLSGTGTDGTLGLRAIKGEGGMVMVQTPDSTEYDGMPRSAIATGLVDYELPPAEMPAQLMAYSGYAFGKPTQLSLAPLPAGEDTRQAIFMMLREATRHDFSQYKLSTMNRRIERRMAVHQIKTLDRYVNYLQHSSAEVEALFRDLLIGVTNFFRDPETFKLLKKQIIPKLFADKPKGSAVRVWSIGCSTGEEAYSLAILLQEHLDALKQDYTVQVFATDIDSKAISTARAGIYPASIAADVTPQRLARFFSAEQDATTYRINKSIRDTVIFSEQDVIRDPPFSKLDLVSCRNLLIYMSTGLQKKIIPLLHYALKPDGFLFLGTSETVGDFGDMFDVFNRKSKLYRRRHDIHNIQRASLGRRLASLTVGDRIAPQAVGRRAGPGKLTLRALTERAILQLAAPTGALVNSQGDILYLHGRAGMYLEPTPGEVSVNNILKMAREGLQEELTSALRMTVTSGEIFRRSGLRVNTNGALTTVNLTITPVVTGPAATNEAPLYLILLEEVAQASSNKTEDSPGFDSSDLETSAYVASLRQELRAKEEYLQTVNEELKSSNEEMQSINEELQSTNEELETSKEELQSVNEELATVNGELQINVTDLTRTNNDMNNMVAGTGIGTVFVDLELRILRFTPDVTRIINLIPGDVGRPVGHIVSNLVGYENLVADVKKVLQNLVPKDVDVQTTEEKWYTMRLQPYHTIDNVIEGAVITFVDITERKRVEDTLQKAFDEIKTLRGIVPICAHCKSIRDDSGFWNQVEGYVRDHSEVEFSHAICPDCLKKHYPELVTEGVKGSKREDDPQ